MIRANLWRQKLLGSSETIKKYRSLYKRDVLHFPFMLETSIQTTIVKDLDRFFVGHSFFREKKNNIEQLLTQYALIMACDGYLQGFNYIVGVLYYVYYNNNPEHAMADAWWSLVTMVSIIRPIIPDHDVTVRKKFCKKWGTYYTNELYRRPRLYAILKPFFNDMIPLLVTRWPMLFFAQNIKHIEDLLKIWDIIIGMEPSKRHKVTAIIAANITIEAQAHLEHKYRDEPSTVGFFLYGFVLDKNIDRVIERTKRAMVYYKLPF